MELRITTDIPANDPVKAKKLLTDLLQSNDLVLGIVVGNDDWSINAIQKVDRVAYSRPEIRRAVWVHDRAVVYPILQNLFVQSGNRTMPDNQPFIITVSMIDKIADLIPFNEPVLDNVRIDKAFLLAEKA